MKPFMDSFTIESFLLIGNSTKAIQDGIKAYGVKPRKLIGAWTNYYLTKVNYFKSVL